MSIARGELFRPELLQARQTVWLGRHTLALGLPASLSSVASFVMAAAAVALLTFGSYARRVEVHGVVLPISGLIQVSSPAAGWVESVRVEEGQTVTSGTPLYVINNDTATSDGHTQQQVLQALAAQRTVLMDQIARKGEMRGEQHAKLHRKSENLQAQIQQMGVQVAMKEEFVRNVAKNYADFSALPGDRDRQRDGDADAAAELDAHQGRARGDEKPRAPAAGGADRDPVPAGDHRPAVRQRDRRDAVEDRRPRPAGRQSRGAPRRSRSARPEPGAVTAIASHAGQTVASGARMLTIVPSEGQDASGAARAQHSIGFIRPGQRVLLRYTAFPYQKFGQYWGTVTEVSHAALEPEELKSLVPSLPPADQSKTFYRVIVAPDRQNVTAYGRPEPLRASMQVEAHVLLERRAIYQWILEPLYGLHGA